MYEWVMNSPAAIWERLSSPGFLFTSLVLVRSTSRGNRRLVSLSCILLAPPLMLSSCLPNKSQQHYVMALSSQRGPQRGALQASVFICVEVGEKVCVTKKLLYIIPTDGTQRPMLCVLQQRCSNRLSSSFSREFTLAPLTAAPPACWDLLWHHMMK